MGKREVRQGEYLRRALAARGICCTLADAALLTDALLDLAEHGLLVPGPRPATDAPGDPEDAGLAGCVE